MSALAGWSGTDEYFRFAELPAFDAAVAEDVLCGRIAGMIVRGFADEAATSQVLASFRRDSHVVARTDDAAGCYLGAYHYGKTTKAYLDDAEILVPTLDRVLGFAGSPWLKYRDRLAAHLGQTGRTLRLAQHQGRAASLGAVRSWAGQGAFALVPHEDGSQCRHPDQRDFEIQQVLERHVCAANVCLQNDGGGRLLFWNVRPDDDSKRALGTFYKGGPYPPESLAGIDLIQLEIGRGDLYIFNGGHVHAVEHAVGARTTASGVLGFVDDRTVVTWT